MEGRPSSRALRQACRAKLEALSATHPRARGDASEAPSEARKRSEEPPAPAASVLSCRDEGAGTALIHIGRPPPLADCSLRRQPGIPPDMHSSRPCLHRHRSRRRGPRLEDSHGAADGVTDSASEPQHCTGPCLRMERIGIRDVWPEKPAAPRQPFFGFFGLVELIGLLHRIQNEAVHFASLVGKDGRHMAQSAGKAGRALEAAKVAHLARQKSETFLRRSATMVRLVFTPSPARHGAGRVLASLLQFYFNTCKRSEVLPLPLALRIHSAMLIGSSIWQTMYSPG